MRIMCSLVIGTLGLAGCLSDDSTGEEPIDDTTDDVVEPAGEDPSAAYCIVPPNPPPATITFDLDQIQNPFIYAVQNYGTGECSSHTSAWVGEGSFKAYVTEPSTADDCVGTKFYVRKYLRDYSGWKLSGTRTIRGEWTAAGCVTEQVHGGLSDNYPSEVRMHVKVHRTTCSGQYCITQYGVPFRLSGTP